MDVDYSKWRAFERMSVDFVGSIRVAYAVERDSAIFVTKVEDVFAIGASFMFLYDYEDEDYLTPRRIDILSQQRIKTFVHFPWGIPNPYFGALSENGHLFTWGGGKCRAT